MYGFFHFAKKLLHFLAKHQIIGHIKNVHKATLIEVNEANLQVTSIVGLPNIESVSKKHKTVLKPAVPYTESAQLNALYTLNSVE